VQRNLSHEELFASSNERHAELNDAV